MAWPWKESSRPSRTKARESTGAQAQLVLGRFGSSPARAALYAWALVLISSVYPSGGAFATSAGAAVLPAPGWFSTIAGLPQAAASLLARARAMTSTPPPAPNGSMIRTERSGKAWSWTTGVEDIGA